MPGFAVGVQWHPENDWRTDIVSRRIFEQFAAAVHAYAANGGMGGGIGSRRGLNAPGHARPTLVIPAVSADVTLDDRTKAVRFPLHNHEQARRMFIETEGTPNPATLKFLPGPLCHGSFHR